MAISESPGTTDVGDIIATVGSTSKEEKVPQVTDRIRTNNV